MTDNKITVVVCSRQTDKEKEEFIEHLKETCGYNVHVMFMINSDGVSLTKIYNLGRNVIKMLANRNLANIIK